MKAIKLIYLADRYHLRKYGRPIIGDSYWAMKYGAVGSTALRVANLEDSLDTDCLKYVGGFIAHQKDDDKIRTILSRKDIDLDVFSQSDLDAFETIYKEFGGYDEFELAEITHKYPEWSKFEKEILSGRTKRQEMNYKDFFRNVKNNATKRDFFDLPQDHLDAMKEMFEENQEITAVIA